MRHFQKIRHLIARFNYGIALVGALAVFATMFTMTADVFARFFKFPLPATVELAEIALGMVIFLGWAYTQEQKGHITIDLLYNILPLRLQRLLSLINPIFGLVLFSIITWQGVEFAFYSKASGEITENLCLPVWPFKLTIALAAVCFCLQLILDVVDAFLKIKEK